MGMEGHADEFLAEAYPQKQNKESKSTVIHVAEC